MLTVVMLVLVGFISVCFYIMDEKIWHGLSISLIVVLGSSLLQSPTASYYFLWLEVSDTCCTSSITQAQENSRIICLSCEFSNYTLVF